MMFLKLPRGTDEGRIFEDDGENEDQLGDDDASEKDGDDASQEESSNKSWKDVTIMLILESSLTYPTSPLFLLDPPSLTALLLLNP